MTEWSDFTIAAQEAALHAGSFLRTAFYKPHTVLSKEGKKNLVTECDLIAEEMILSFLQDRFPSHGFLSEEKGISGKVHPEYIWIIDPLDGTVNFSYQIPIFTVSIGLFYKNTIISAAIYQPMTDELFLAEKGKGAFLHETRLQVSLEKDLPHSFLAVELPYNVSENPSACLDPLISFLRKDIALRRLGSASLNLAYVAAGRFDGFFEKSLYPWDVAAGILLVEEAGGCISNYEGKTHQVIEKDSLLASNLHLHEKLLSSIQRKYS